MVVLVTQEEEDREEAVEIPIIQIIPVRGAVVVAVATMTITETEAVAHIEDLGETIEGTVDLGQTIHNRLVVIAV